MNAPASYLSPEFPSREAIKRAAFVDAQITAMRNNGIPVPPTLQREAQHAMAVFRNLPPHEQAMVSRVFNADIATLVEATHVEAEERQADALHAKTDALMKELTQGIGGRPQGLTLELAAALRSGDKVQLKTRKLPTGAVADARVKAHTGMTLKEYEAKLDEALEMRNRFRYNDEAKYHAWLAQNFPGKSPKDVDRMVRNWAVEGAGLELQRRAQKDTPDVVTARPLTAEERRRLDLIEAVAEHEAPNPRSIFQKDQKDRLREIASERGERKDDLRASIAEAFLANGADGFDVEVGPIRDDASDEIVGIEEQDNG